MHTDRFVFAVLSILGFILSPFSQGALASDSLPTDSPAFLYTNLPQTKNPTKFTITPAKNETEALSYTLSTSPQTTMHYGGKRQFTDSAQSEDWEDQILTLVPHGEQLKQVWHIVDGDVDLHFTGLRIDRKNKGVAYTMNTVPLIGKMDKVEFKFKAGDDHEFSFKTRGLPLFKKGKRLNLQGAIGNNKSSISARYTIPLK